MSTILVGVLIIACQATTYASLTSRHTAFQTSAPLSYIKKGTNRFTSPVKNPNAFSSSSPRVPLQQFGLCGSTSSRAESAIRCQVDVEQVTNEEFKDPKTGETMTLAGKEELFLDTLDAFYNGGTSPLTDDQYEALKLDLQFSDSRIGLFSKDELRYLIAQKRYRDGNSIISDEEWDKLRLDLKAKNSIVAYHETPKCSVETGTCKMDMQPDDGKNALLYVPALSLCLFLYTEITFYLYNWDPLIMLLLGSPFLFLAAKLITEQVLFQDPLIVSAVCPSCSSYMNVFFGDIIFIQGTRPTTQKFKCSNCKIELIADREKLLLETPPKK